jgi:hypothetical protein
MNENWDRFEPLQRIKKQDFFFQPSRYLVWVDGELLAQGSISAKVIAKTIKQDGSEKVRISFNEIQLQNELLSELYFDELVTAHDRLQLIVIPNESNARNTGLLLLKMVFGATCQQKNFSSKEPYCCNLFFRNHIISKITFTFSNPEKLIELYQ